METSTIVEIRTKSGNSFDLELPLTVPIERFSPLVLSSSKKAGSAGIWHKWESEIASGKWNGIGAKAHIG